MSAREENTKINYGLDTTGEKKEDVQEKREWKEYKQPWQQEISIQINGETDRNGDWFPEDGDSC
jgi:hypothetical protein